MICFVAKCHVVSLPNFPFTILVYNILARISTLRTRVTCQFLPVLYLWYISAIVLIMSVLMPGLALRNQRAVHNFVVFMHMSIHTGVE